MNSPGVALGWEPDAFQGVLLHGLEAAPRAR